jgi:branched-chain amino acid transport system substrate-binding protein
MTSDSSNEESRKNAAENLDNLLSLGRLASQWSGGSSPQTDGHRTVPVEAGMIMAVLLLLALSIMLPQPAAAASPIKIGFAYVLSGPQATFGQVAKQGAELAVREINEREGILGRQIEAVFADTEGKPDAAVSAMEKLINEEKVDVVIGFVVSPAAIAALPVAEKLRTPLIVTHSMAMSITGEKRNPWVFRINWRIDQCAKSAATVANRNLKAKKWAGLGPDNVMSVESWDYFKKYLSELGPYTFLDNTLVPFSTADWRPVIKGLRDSGVEGIFLMLWGNNLRDFIRQAKEVDFAGETQLLCPIGASVEIFVALGFLDMPKGIWFGAPYWYEAYDNPANTKFVESYKKARGVDIPPSYAAYMPYAAVKMYQAAVERAGSADKTAVRTALEGVTAELPVGRTTFRPEDHQAVFEFAFGQVAGTAKGTKRFRGLDPIEKVSGELVTAR